MHMLLLILLIQKIYLGISNPEHPPPWKTVDAELLEVTIELVEDTTYKKVITINQFGLIDVVE